MEKIKDFGEKIGYARKDIWQKRGLMADDIDFMTEDEKNKYVMRDNIWPLPDAKQLVKDGHDPFIVFWQRAVRRKIYKYPPNILYASNKDEVMKSYIQAVKDLREMVEACEKEEDLARFYLQFSKEEKFYVCARKQTIVFLKYEHIKLKNQMKKANFPYGKGTKGGPARKQRFVPPQLSHIQREGEVWRPYGRNVTPEMWQKEFNFRGVEFGNWLSQNDRQISMNYCFDALKDLASVLGIQETDVAFGGKLALAFGARGRSGAMAHYEPVLKVINLTKMNGAGSTAHEWAHALDNMLGKEYQLRGRDQMASDYPENQKIPESFRKVVQRLKYDENGKWTEYFKNSLKFDAIFAKDSFGYWSSGREMFARAFACYVKDKYGKKSDYLFAHADIAQCTVDGEMCYAYPRGNDRKILNGLFKELFSELKKTGFFTEKNYEKVTKPTLTLTSAVSDYDFEVQCEADGQLRLCI